MLKENEGMQHNINYKTARTLVLHIRMTPTIDLNDKQLKMYNTVLSLKLLLRHMNYIYFKGEQTQ